MLIARLRSGDEIYVSDQGTSVTDDSKSQRRLRARIGGLSLHIFGNSNEIARRARAGFDNKFYREALELDPNLSPTELETLVKRLRSLYFARLSLQSAKSRAKKNHRTNGNY